MEAKLDNQDVEKALLHCKMLKKWLLANSANTSEVEELMKGLCESIAKVGGRTN